MQTMLIWVQYEKDGSRPFNLYSLDERCIFLYDTKNEQQLYFLTPSSHTWHQTLMCLSQGQDGINMIFLWNYANH